MSFPKYPAYKDSGVQWLGEVPEHWEVTRLKNIFELMKREPLAEDEIVTAFRDGTVTLRSNRRTEGFTNAIQEHGYQRILRNDLVIHAMDAFAGAIGVSDSDGKSTPVYSACRIKFKEFNVYYFGKLLRYMALSGFINSLAKGIRERSTEFRWNEASNIFISTPPPSEQQAIADFLDRETGKIDALIQEQQRLIELLKEKRQAVISHAVTKGLDPDVPMKQSGIEWLGDIPEHWGVVPIKKIVSTPVTDGPHETPVFLDEGVPFVSAEAISTGIIDFNKIRGFISLADHHRFCQKYKPCLGDIYMVKSGASTGTTAIVEDGREFSIWSPLAAIRCNNESNSKFILNYLRSRNFQEGVILNWSYGTQQNIGMKVIENLCSVRPPLQEQQAIADFLDRETGKIDQLIEQQKDAISLLQERRTALISAAVTGKIDVREFASREAS